jgi:NADPH-dependent curcumin reductase CurA
MLATPPANRQFRLAQRPTGRVDVHTFALETTPAPTPGPGEALVRALYLSLDPTNRIWITDMEQYMPPVQIGEVMRGYGIGQIVVSNTPDLAPGDLVNGLLGWQDYTLTGPANPMQKLPAGLPIPVPSLLSVCGATGLTAFFGLTELGAPKAGETLLVSAASGAVGSVVGQIGKILGLRVVGITGGPEKCRYITETLGFDAAVDYRAADWRAQLEGATPAGIDINFENVGGDIMDAVMHRMNLHSRLVLCGMISGYNDAAGKSLGDFTLILMKRITVRGFIILDYLPRFTEGAMQLMQWMFEGKLKGQETVVDGLENAPEALNKLFDGDKIGKLMIKVAEKAE